MYPMMFLPTPFLCRDLIKLGNDYDIPPTVYSILNSYVNYSRQTPAKIKDLARTGRQVFFDFDYPLTNKITKADFETMILNHFLMRRIGYETVTAFNIALSVKINEIMPKYNILFDAMHGWELFNDGENISRQMTDNTTSESSSSTSSSSSSEDSATSDRRFSNTPQNALSDVRAGTYVTEYNYDSNGSESSVSSESSMESDGEDNKTVNETISKSQKDRVKAYTDFINNVNNVYSMIFNELEPLFYSLVL